MIKAGIIGATGYAGAELVRILMGHKEVEIVWYGSRSYIDQKYASVYHNMFEIVDAACLDDNMEALCEQVDVIFTATPQGFLGSVLTEEILSKTKIVDLSADFRIKDIATYEKWYKIEHKSPQFIEEAVYGLCEINRDKVKNARLVANPGCYTTCSILTAYPLVKEGLIDPDTLIIDAKSGTSGAGLPVGADGADACDDRAEPAACPCGKGARPALLFGRAFGGAGQAAAPARPSLRCSCSSPFP